MNETLNINVEFIYGMIAGTVLLATLGLLGGWILAKFDAWSMKDDDDNDKTIYR